MLDLMKKGFFTGLGVAALTKDKIEGVAKEYVDKGKMSEQEGEKLVAEMLVCAEKSRGEFQQQVQESVKAVLHGLDVAQSHEVAELRAEVSTLRSELAELKHAQKASAENPA